MVKSVLSAANLTGLKVHMFAGELGTDYNRLNLPIVKERWMSDQSFDPLNEVQNADDLLGRIRSKLAEFVGYVDRDQRREADRILRQSIADRYEEQWSRISSLQREMISEGGLDWVDDMEASALKLRAFIDRVRTASYGYAGLFDHVRINQDELAKLYALDYSLLEKGEEVEQAVDEVEAAMEGEGLGQAVKQLENVSQEAVDMFNRREQTILAES